MSKLLIHRQRRSIRLPHYNYAQAGFYFITICTHNRIPLFGEIVDGVMQCNQAGKIARDEWQNIPQLRSAISLAEFIVMPNHIHGIVVIDAVVANPDGLDSAGVQRAPTVGDIVRGYKSAVTSRLRRCWNDSGAVVWQRNYYEHIIRSDDSYQGIAEYIVNNPLQWHLDRYYVR